MGQITGGRVLFGDAIKHNPGDQFSLSRKAEAEFSFGAKEGEAIDDLLKLAMQLAQATVTEMLSGKKATAVKVEQAAANGDASKAAFAEKEKAPKKPPKAAVVEAEPAKVEDAKPVDPAPPADDMDELLSTGPAQITDAELLDKIKAKNGALIAAGHKTSPQAIKALVAAMFRPEELPKQAREIPMVLRPDFLEKLTKIEVPKT